MARFCTFTTPALARQSRKCYGIHVNLTLVSLTRNYKISEIEGTHIQCFGMRKRGISGLFVVAYVTKCSFLMLCGIAIENSDIFYYFR